MKKPIYSEQQTLFGHKTVIGFGDEKLYVKEINRDIANDIIIKNHYSGKIYNATYIHLGVFINNKLHGVLQYGYAMNPNSMSSVVANTKKNEYLELNRMWIEDDVGDYVESKSIAYSIKFIKMAFPKVKWIQSFADERCGGYGVVYQACSFDYFGEHTSDFWELDGVVYHNIQMTVSEDSHRYKGEARYLQQNKDRATKMQLRQFRYIKFLKQNSKKYCLLKQQEYPKHYL